MSSQYNMEGQKNDASRNDERRPSNDESREDEKHPHNDATRNDERRPGNDESRNDGSHRNSDAPRNDESSPNNDESREDEMHPNNDATRNDERRPNNGEQGAPANDQQALMRPDVNIRDENIARELRVASFQKWQKVYKAAVGNWVAIGKPPCKTCKKTHPPPHTTNAQRAELGQLKKFGHELCGDPEAPQCQRCRKSHYGKCRALPCGSCGFLRCGGQTRHVICCRNAGEVCEGERTAAPSASPINGLWRNSFQCVDEPRPVIC
ncbi:hypothetical protein HDK90DRAFT_222935 [Phyllosticta capitalensis]|uniref:Uncharacterized protein n=1 Tax=Phyllosticta capitalensis TaxID=121624 RepID=A0ABR1YTL7_9PEZI